MKTAAFLSALTFPLLLQYAYGDGDPVTITVTGNIVASPCKVDPDSITKSIPLGDIQATDMSQAGSGSAWQTFDIKVTDCPAGTSRVTATFHGTPDADTPDSVYQNTGTATNVGVELQGTGGDLFGDGKYYGIDLNGATTATWHLRTRAYTAKGAAMPGTISSVITVSFTYN